MGDFYAQNLLQHILSFIRCALLLHCSTAWLSLQCCHCDYFGLEAIEDNESLQNAFASPQVRRMQDL